ncbi:hypothetical protein LR48_Vigan03g177400 [Vigna angularis]|uniref:Uncharacterized protein n=1 Tax=Phaseolus angularis TaxID=3914 RepID=A0A0L9U6T6_PHAAN|nr:hypothetical protein LR48_Vigan03g177400 [Vigna angularis]
MSVSDSFHYGAYGIVDAHGDVSDEDIHDERTCVDAILTMILQRDQGSRLKER